MSTRPDRDLAESPDVVVVRGRSMVPFLRRGDILALERAGDQLRPGDIVVFRQRATGAGRFVVHRVVGRQPSPGGVVTQGDNVDLPDGEVPLNDIVGRVRARFSAGRWVPLSVVERRAGLYLAPLWRKARRFGRNLPLPGWRRLGEWIMQMIEIKKDIIYREEGDDALLFCPETGAIKVLNETGAFLFRQLRRGTDREKILDQAVARYETVARATLEHELDRFAHELTEAGIAVQAD